ncbi:MAG TPA: pyridoxal phosphate-dependent aminotransferase [Ramlibacter sp.]|nr:pyridoxal phosphate-dependent aminotransferase [Ramlibacter sp.]
MRIAKLIEKIEPFYVMEVAKAASQLAREVAHTTKPMIFLNIGEPDFTAPPLVQAAAQRAIDAGKTQYTHAVGLDSLREKISGWYQQRFDVDVPAKRIVVTAGASAALKLACLALIEPGEEILMPDPSYPCNCHFVTVAGGEPVRIPSTPAERYQLSAAKIAEHWNEKTRGVLLASPSNPTGTSIHPAELRRIHEFVSSRDGITLLDEIYLGLSYEETYGHTALSISDQIISINSFSKYFNMTGWRLGWVVAPDDAVLAIEKLTQNLYICPSAVAQHAAHACFEPESIAEYERRRAEFKRRRDWFIPQLRQIGFDVPVVPDGAFYAWADCSAICKRLGVKDSWDLTFEIMKRAHVAVTPGRDFGVAQAAHFIRFSTASSMEHLEEAAQRLKDMLA